MIPSHEATEILLTRARALARTSVSAADAQPKLDLLEFRLATERYAIESRYVEEVRPLRELTPLPCTPAFVLGIINVRGRILPLLDLKKLIDLPAKGLTDLHRVILVRGDTFEVGLLADVVVGLVALNTARLHPSLPTLTGINAHYLKGVTDDRLVVLDLDHILMDPRIIVREDVAS